MGLFTEIALILLVVVVISILMKILKQPLIVGYILSGIIVGPYLLNILKSTDNIEFFSKFGITILLFIVGLNLNPKVIKDVGKVSAITGIGQVLFTSIIGFLICRILGFNIVTSFYASVALTFSSTIIVMKLLSDKGDGNSLYGKISIGFLLVQDLIAAIILVLVSYFGKSLGDSVILSSLTLLIKIFFIIISIYFITSKILSRIISFLASSSELLFLFSITWGLFFSALFYRLGFSLEIGALIAGVALSTSDYSIEIASRLKPLRDFFIILFFVLLGSQMVLESFGVIIFPAIILSLFVLIGNPLIVFILMNLMGYKKNTAFMAGLTVAQISEFSLILIALGVSVGHLQADSASLITLVGLTTITASTYMINYSELIYNKISKYLNYFQFRKNSKKVSDHKEENFEVILFGYDRVGKNMVEAIGKLQKNFCVVDYNPDSIKKLNNLGIPHEYGDAQDIEFLEDVGIKNVKIIISTIPSFETNKFLVRTLHNINPDALSIVISHSNQDTLELYNLGASYVIVPIYLGARLAAHLIKKYGLDKSAFAMEKEKHLKHLRANFISS